MTNVKKGRVLLSSDIRFSIPAVEKEGSIYLQGLAKYLREEYMRKPLDRILRMVRQDMIKKMQV